jgi:hypothetical protein
MVHQLKEAFIGEVQDLLVQSELEWCTQLCYNVQLQWAEEILLLQHYKEFTNIITGVPYMVDTPFPFVIGAIFYDTVKPAIRHVLKGDTTIIPKATTLELPAMVGLLQGLMGIKDLFIAMDKKLALI